MLSVLAHMILDPAHRIPEPVEGVVIGKINAVHFVFSQQSYSS